MLLFDAVKGQGLLFGIREQDTCGLYKPVLFQGRKALASWQLWLSRPMAGFLWGLFCLCSVSVAPLNLGPRPEVWGRAGFSS